MSNVFFLCFKFPVYISNEKSLDEKFLFMRNNNKKNKKLKYYDFAR